MSPPDICRNTVSRSVYLLDNIGLTDGPGLDDITDEVPAAQVLRRVPGEGDRVVSDITHHQRPDWSIRLHHHTCTRVPEEGMVFMMYC